MSVVKRLGYERSMGQSAVHSRTHAGPVLDLLCRVMRVDTACVAMVMDEGVGRAQGRRRAGDARHLLRARRVPLGARARAAADHGRRGHARGRPVRALRCALRCNACSPSLCRACTCTLLQGMGKNAPPEKGVGAAKMSMRAPLLMQDERQGRREGGAPHALLRRRAPGRQQRACARHPVSPSFIALVCPAPCAHTGGMSGHRKP